MHAHPSTYHMSTNQTKRLVVVVMEVIHGPHYKLDEMNYMLVS